MISSERATYLPTLSPLPNGDILNSSNTIVSPSAMARFSTPHQLGFPLYTRRHRQLCALIQPDLRVLDLAQQAESIQRLTQQGSAFFEVWLGLLRMLAKLTKPLHNSGEFLSEDSFRIFLHEA